MCVEIAKVFLMCKTEQKREEVFQREIFPQLLKGFMVLELDSTQMETAEILYFYRYNASENAEMNKKMKSKAKDKRDLLRASMSSYELKIITDVKGMLMPMVVINFVERY